MLSRSGVPMDRYCSSSFISVIVRARATPARLRLGRRQDVRRASHRGRTNPSTCSKPPSQSGSTRWDSVAAFTVRVGGAAALTRQLRSGNLQSRSPIQHRRLNRLWWSHRILSVAAISGQSQTLTLAANRARARLRSRCNRSRARDCSGASRNTSCIRRRGPPSLGS
jgi:hypothetical protein